MTKVTIRPYPDRKPNLDEDPKNTLNLECVLVSPVTRARARRNFVADA